MFTQSDFAPKSPIIYFVFDRGSVVTVNILWYIARHILNIFFVLRKWLLRKLAELEKPETEDFPRMDNYLVIIFFVFLKIENVLAENHVSLEDIALFSGFLG